MKADKQDLLKPEDLIIYPTKSKYMKIKKGNKNFYLDPTKYDVSNLMMLLDKNKLKKLEEEFKHHPGGIKKIDFINIMLNELGSDYEDRINLVYGIYKLFLEIDFNGDGTMQWEEFTQFIIDTVMGENDKKDGEEEDDMIGLGKDINEKALIKYKRYAFSNKAQDRSLHETDITECQFAPKLDLLFCVEYKSKKIRLYNPKTGRSDKVFDLDQYFTAESQKGLSKDKHKKKPDAKQALTYSILSITVSPMNIVALCTTNKKIIFFEFGNDGKAEKKIELDTPFLQKKVWYLPDHNVWMSTGAKNEDEFFKLYELDVEFEYKQNKWDIATNIGTKVDDKIHMDPFRKFIIDKHKGEILDVIEIRKPNLYILTGCMDQKIRLINLYENEIVKIWQTKITSAVRSLDYNPNIGAGFILSVGFEYYINIWSPVVALDEAHYGTLEGHYSPVISCKFLSGSPMCVSCDEEGNVRIWDTRTKTTLQLIPQEKKNFKINKLLCLHKYNKIILYGNKILFLDPKYTEVDDKPKYNKLEENYPLKVCFNHYFLTFYVTTMKDVKIYSSKNGELIKSLKFLKANINDSDVKIKQFLFDEGNRKFYLGFSNGAIQQFNAGNGSLIKKIGENEEEKDGITTTRYDHTADIIDLHLDSENQILLSCALDSLINVYDERDPEEASKLRTLKGGHKVGERTNQIFAFAFSSHLNLFVTGSTNGLITVWDYELSKIEDVCFLPHSKLVDVYSLVFLDPYPIFVATYSDGSVLFWGVKSSKYRGDCVLRGRNNITLLGKTETFPAYTMLYVNREMNAIPSTRGNINKRIIPKDQFLNYETQHTARTETLNDTMSYDGKIVVKVPDDEEEDLDIDPAKYSQTPIKSYLLLGDQKGNIKILDLKGFFKKYEIDPVPHGTIKSTYNILKKDDINVESILAYNLQKGAKKLPNFKDINTTMTLVDIAAHDDTINSISLIEDPFSYVTCSKDKKVKIWSFNGEILGEIATHSSLGHSDRKLADWKFKVDWEKLKEKEITEVIKIFEHLGGEPIKFDESKLDEVSHNIKVEDSKRNDRVIQMPKDRSRYKPLEQQKKKDSEKKDDNDDNNIDDQYHQEIIENINKVVSPSLFNVGLTEMVRTLFDGNKQTKEEEKDKTGKEENALDKKLKQGINKIQSINNSSYKQVNRVNLYSDKYSKAAVADKHSIEESVYHFPSRLPKIKEDNKYINVKFNKGETDRILSYEQYKSSYDNCCLIGNSNVSNYSLQKNFKMMWKYVQDYSKIVNQKGFKNKY